MITKKIIDDFFSEKLGLILAGIGLISIFVSAIVFICCGDWFFTKTLDEAKVAQYGDFIGGVIGSLFALSGVILYYVALKEQRKEIGINQEALNLQIEALNHQVEEFKGQKEEMLETRKIYDEQTKEFKRQTDIAKLQQFDSSFYSLLNVLVNVRKELNENSGNKNYFESIYNKLKAVDIKNKSIKDTFEIILNKYTEVFQENHSELTHYFKTVFQIIKMIDRSSIESLEKLQYANILRSQLTNPELLVLFYDYHSKFGEKVRPLSIKYRLFKHLNVLDRIEYEFNDNFKEKASLTLFVNQLLSLISTNIIKYNDIEENKDIDIGETTNLYGIKSSVSLLLEEKFELTISFLKIDWELQQVIDKEFVKKIVSISIYDALFLSKYKIPEIDCIEVEYVESEKNFKVKFSIDNIKNI